MSSRTFAITVFTPTYNRAHLLPRVYGSLIRQTFTDFEWLVVDDGSTDHTVELIARWQQEVPFPIRYVWQPNQYKKVARNWTRFGCHARLLAYRDFKRKNLLARVLIALTFPAGCLLTEIDRWLERKRR